MGSTGDLLRIEVLFLLHREGGIGMVGGLEFTSTLMGGRKRGGILLWFCSAFSIWLVGRQAGMVGSRSSGLLFVNI